MSISSVTDVGIESFSQLSDMDSTILVNFLKSLNDYGVHPIDIHLSKRKLLQLHKYFFYHFLNSIPTLGREDNFFALPLLLPSAKTNFQ